MSLLVLVPGLISIFLVLRGRIETAFLSVYLPCLLLVPDEYRVRIPHLPPTSAAEFALLPLGLVGVYRLMRRRSFALMDILVVLYFASVSLSELLHSPVLNDAIFSTVSGFITTVLAYTAGRELIEPGLRLAAVRRWVILILLNGPTGLYEWRMGQSLYGMFGVRVLQLTSIGEAVQLRSGHGRMGEVFGGGECGGIAFAMTFCLNAWLVYLRRVKAPVDLGKTLTLLEKYHVPGMLLLLYLLLSQSRGPEIAMGAGLLILQIPRFKDIRLMTILVAVLLVGGYIAATAYFSAYTSAIDPTTLTEQQGSALYRRHMNEAYAPIAEEGGLTGYGVMGIPHVQGMMSIDNHYLLIHLSSGLLAYALFLLIAWENIRVLVVRSWQLQALEDRAFVFSMMAAMAVLWITLLTVFLGSQLPQLSFLLIGWIQSTGPGNLIKGSSVGAASRLKEFSFRRVFS